MLGSAGPAAARLSSAMHSGHIPGLLLCRQLILEIDDL